MSWKEGTADREKLGPLVVVLVLDSSALYNRAQLMTMGWPTRCMLKLCFEECKQTPRFYMMSIRGRNFKRCAYLFEPRYNSRQYFLPSEEIHLTILFQSFHQSPFLNRFDVRVKRSDAVIHHLSPREVNDDASFSAFKSRTSSGGTRCGPDLDLPCCMSALQ